jgi:hypothetical protein
VRTLGPVLLVCLANTLACGGGPDETFDSASGCCFYTLPGAEQPAPAWGDCLDTGAHADTECCDGGPGDPAQHEPRCTPDTGG